MRAAKGEGSGFKAKTGTHKGQYRGYVTINGKRKYTPWFATKTELEQTKREMLNRRDKGQLAVGRTPTLEVWMLHWLDSVAKHRPTTYAMDKWVIEKRIIPKLGTVRLDKLSTEMIEQWVSDLKIKPVSQRRYLAPMKTALELAYERGKIVANPATKVKLEQSAASRSKSSAYSTEDRAALLAAAKGLNRVQWTIALKHGLRPAERLGLSWLDFDEMTRTLYVRNQVLRATGVGLYLQSLTKTAAGERKIVLPKSTVAMLVEHRREQLKHIAEMGEKWVGWEFEGQPVALMFPQANGRPVGSKMDTQAWHRLQDAAGLSNERRYKARHTSATHMINDSGGDVAATAYNLGHSDPAFTYRTYVHALEERLQAMADKMEDESGAPFVHPKGATQVNENELR